MTKFSECCSRQLSIDWRTSKVIEAVRLSVIMAEFDSVTDGVNDLSGFVAGHRWFIILRFCRLSACGMCASVASGRTPMQYGNDVGRDGLSVLGR